MQKQNYGCNLKYKNKAQLVKMMHRNGYYLPSKSSTIITVNWMLDVKDGIEWCPKYVDVKLRACVDRPLKSYIL